MSRVALLSLAAIVLSVTTLSAQATPPVTFHACYVPLTGTVYRIMEPRLPQACASPEHVQFSWTQGADSVSGDLDGSLPSPTVTGLHGRPLAAAEPEVGQVLRWDGSEWVPAAAPEGGTASDHGALTGLTNDDHPQYLPADGSRGLTGDLNAAGHRLTNLAAAAGPGQALVHGQGVGGDLGGDLPSPEVAGLRGRPVDSSAPADGDVLSWDGNAWRPANVAPSLTSPNGMYGISVTDAGIVFHGPNAEIRMDQDGVVVDGPMGEIRMDVTGTALVGPFGEIRVQGGGITLASEGSLEISDNVGNEIMMGPDLQIRGATVVDLASPAILSLRGSLLTLNGCGSPVAVQGSSFVVNGVAGSTSPVQGGAPTVCVGH